MKKLLILAAVILATVSAGYTCYDKMSQEREFACIPPYTNTCSWEGSIHLPGIKYVGD